MEWIRAIREHGWRQGSVLTEAVARLAFAGSEPVLPPDVSGQDAVVILVSQDCDINSRDSDKEPWAEAIAFVPASEPDGNLMGLRNPRRLQFEIKGMGIVEGCVHHRFRFPRACLATEPPDGERVLTAEQTAIIARWMARRYERTGLPDSFDQRIGDKDRRRIAKLLAPVATELDALYISLGSWRELSSDEDYALNVIGTMRCSTYANQDARRRVEEALMAIEEVLSCIKGVRLNEEGVMLRAEDEVSLADLRACRYWDFERLSHET